MLGGANIKISQRLAALLAMLAILTMTSAAVARPTTRLRGGGSEQVYRSLDTTIVGLSRSTTRRQLGMSKGMSSKARNGKSKSAKSKGKSKSKSKSATESPTMTPTTAMPVTGCPTTAAPTLAAATPAPSTAAPTLAAVTPAPTTAAPTLAGATPAPTTAAPTLAGGVTPAPTTAAPTTATPTTAAPTTAAPTTAAPTPAAVAAAVARAGVTTRAGPQQVSLQNFDRTTADENTRTIPAAAKLVFNFSKGKGRKPTTTEIDTLVAETQQFFQTEFQTNPAVSPVFQDFQMKDVTPIYDGNGTPDSFVLEFLGLVVLNDNANNEVRQVLEVMSESDFHNYVGNVLQSAPLKWNEFYETHSVSFAGVGSNGF